MNNQLSDLKVYYGFCKINKIRKHKSISVVFENELRGCRIERGQRTRNSLQVTCYERFQTIGEAEDAKKCNRIFSGYDIILDRKDIKGDLEKALEINSQADRFNVSEQERERIKQVLHDNYRRVYE